jgi:protein involved in polysaccharide export with SLBB domain
MTARYWFVRSALALIALVPATVAAQQPAAADTALANKPLATRPQLEELARRGGPQASQAQVRLKEGDFRPGDLVRIAVQAESTLTDTFTVNRDRGLELPSPVMGSLPLAGVLRAELEPKVVEFIGRFVQNAKVRAWPLVRISIQGEVARAGVYGIEPDAVISDAVMAAGGATASADLRKIKIERDGKKLYEGKDVERAVHERLTINDAALQDGDRIIVSRRNGTTTENLRFVYLITGVAGGIYGLTRIF